MFANGLELHLMSFPLFANGPVRLFPSCLSRCFCLDSVQAGRAAFNKIPRGRGPSSGLINGVALIGGLGYLGYNSVFTGQ